MSKFTCFAFQHNIPDVLLMQECVDVDFIFSDRCQFNKLSGFFCMSFFFVGKRKVVLSCVELDFFHILESFDNV